MWKKEHSTLGKGKIFYNKTLFIYSYKIWWELNLVDRPQPVWTLNLADLNLGNCAEQRIMHVYTILQHITQSWKSFLSFSRNWNMWSCNTAYHMSLDSPLITTCIRISVHVFALYICWNPSKQMSIDWQLSVVSAGHRYTFGIL